MTCDLPPSITAATGLDALAQLIEPYLSARSSPLIDPWCLDGIGRVARSLPVAFRDGSNLAARTDMALASLLGGLALANAALGAVHGFAGPIGGRFAAPHGAICAALLPHVLRANVAALASRHPGSDRLGRADRVAQVLTGRGDARAADGVLHLDALRRDLGIPGLAAYGLRESDVPGLVAQARHSSSMRGNPIELTDEELTRVLLSAMRAGLWPCSSFHLRHHPRRPSPAATSSTATIASISSEWRTVNRNRPDSLPTRPVAAQATAIDCGEIILPVTPPDALAATASSGSMPIRSADTACRRPNTALADVSDPVMNTPSHPSTGDNSGNSWPVPASATPIVVVMPDAFPM